MGVYGEGWSPDGLAAEPEEKERLADPFSAGSDSRYIFFGGLITWDLSLGPMAP